ncbi:MAG TPA: serine/threonine-protein kinase [Myxococcaceae bacterium]|nr:serine/threonine-protein kinase [Myxococcaceae bacterium]
MPVSFEDTLPLTPSPGAPSFIGPYRVLQLLGEGGMGEVWLVEQTEPVRRKAAVKIIKVGMDTRQVVARFESERQALALMDHPAIAKVLDGGATHDGRPYFVLEYVPGVRITEHCDAHQLDTRERIELFIQVCEGVQHAHQKAVIHRDLKPSNVLVSLVDGRAQPKIIDFGIAKAVGQRLTEKTLFTEIGAVIGTPEYMSPEQANLTGQDVDTRTDVYSLGVMLYELLTGRLPFASDELRSSGFDELRRVIREVQPPRPSDKVSTLGQDSRELAQRHRTEPAALCRQLEGDLDWITLKALEKERNRRYGTPSELVADLRRHLRNEPVLAGPPSRTYRVRKYVQRHRVGVAAAAGLVLLLIGFAVTEAIQARQIARERDRANAEAEASKRVSDFLLNMFKVSDPSEARGVSITAREILDRASKNIDTGLARDPRLAARMMDTMGQVYQNLGLYSRAEPLLGKALETRRNVLGEESPDTLVSMTHLAALEEAEGRLADAEKLERTAVDRGRQVLGPDHPTTLTAMKVLAVLDARQGRYPEAEKLTREALDGQRRAFGPDSPAALKTTHNLALMVRNQGRLPEAEALEREAVENERRVLGPDHPETLLAMDGLAGIELLEGRTADAEPLYREVLATRRRVLGPEHAHTLTSMNNLAELYEREGRLDEAQALMLETRDIQARVLGPNHPDTAFSTYNLGLVAARRGQRDDAFRLINEALDRGLAPEHGMRMREDPELASIRDDPRFDALVARAESRTAARR